jgi:hypothetical protein
MIFFGEKNRRTEMEMKQWIFIITIAHQIALSAWAQNINTEAIFPDPNFRVRAEQFMGVPPGGAFTAVEAAAKTGLLYCHGMNITSFQGIEYFTNLEEFNCEANPITELNLQNNPQLLR